MTHKLFQPNTSSWTDELETSVAESNYADYIEQPHLLSMRVDRMGTVQATQIVSYCFNSKESNFKNSKILKF